MYIICIKNKPVNYFRIKQELVCRVEISEGILIGSYFKTHAFAFHLPLYSLASFSLAPCVNTSPTGAENKPEPTNEPAYADRFRKFPGKSEFRGRTFRA